MSGGSFFEVRLDLFDGPIDLLLHLVKEHELEIERVSLAEVTQQYLDCLDRMRELDLDVAAEYLVVAATLVSIKAAILLADPVDFENTPEDQMPDPHRELLMRLREAQVYKEGAHSLAGRKLLNVDVFSREPTISDFDDGIIATAKHDVLLLGQAFQKLLSRTGDDGRLYEIKIDTVSVVERMMTVVDRLRGIGGRSNFVTLIPDAKNRGSIIVTFIAMLELVKRRVIFVKQSATAADEEGEIIIALSSADVDVGELSSEFDAPGGVTEGASVAVGGNGSEV